MSLSGGDQRQAAGKSESDGSALGSRSEWSNSCTESVSELHSPSGAAFGEDPSIDKNRPKMNRNAITAPMTINSSHHLLDS